MGLHVNSANRRIVQRDPLDLALFALRERQYGIRRTVAVDAHRRIVDCNIDGSWRAFNQFGGKRRSDAWRTRWAGLTICSSEPTRSSRATRIDAQLIVAVAGH